MKHRYLEQPSLHGRPAEFAMIIEDGVRIAESEWFRQRKPAAKDMVEFLEAALVIAKKEMR